MSDDEYHKFRVAVFVERGKRKWKFRAYTCIYNPVWDGCNIVDVEARNGTEAKTKALEIVKARMDLNSQIPPRNVRVAEP